MSGRINHWLCNIMPVAEEYGIQMARHHSDPGNGYGLRYCGAARILGIVDGFKKVIGHSATARTTASTSAWAASRRCSTTPPRSTT